MINILRRISSLNKDLFSGAVSAGSTTLLVIITYPVYLHFLGTELYGLWTTLNVLLIFARMVNVNTSPAITKFIARSYENKQIYETIRYIISALYIVITISLLIIAILFIVRAPLAGLLDLQPNYYQIAVDIIPLIALLIASVLMMMVFNGALMGLGKVQLANYLTLFRDVIRFAFAVIFLLAGLGVWSIPIGWLIANLIIFIVFNVFIHRQLKSNIYKFLKIDWAKTKEIMKFGKYLTGAHIANLGFLPFVKFVIARYIGLSEVTFFDIAWKVLVSIKTAIDKANQTVIPYIGRKFKDIEGLTYKQNLKEIRTIHHNALKFALSISLPLYAVLFFFSKPIFSVWLGNNYDFTISKIIMILVSAFIMDAVASPVYFSFIGIGMPNLCMYSDTLKSFITFVCIMIAIFVLQINLIYITIIILTSLILSKLFLINRFHKIVGYI